MEHSPALQRYLEGFTYASGSWNSHTTTHNPTIGWWRTLPWQNNHMRGWSLLCDALPQLRLPQEIGISHSAFYRELVLCGKDYDSNKMHDAAKYINIEALRFQIVRHPYLTIPVFTTPYRHDFEWLVRALAFRSEPVAIDPGVHAQAISGLIHWGLIRSIGSNARASLILLHDSPYSTVPAHEVPGQLTHLQWLQASSALRLEHELTHLTTKQQLGEMRINLLDELIADTMGQLFALGVFSAELFSRCLNQRWRSYVSGLNSEECEQVLLFVSRRAYELESALIDWHGAVARSDTRLQLLPWLCRLRLDQPIAGLAPPPQGNMP